MATDKFMNQAITSKEKAALSQYWGMKLRVRNGNIEALKRGCWGILCSESAGIENARILIERSK
jgi:hypothetical protein